MTPRILVVGSGRFGKQHLRVLTNLHREKKIELVGVVVRDFKKQKRVSSEFKVKTFSRITSKLLKSIDAIDIVTPSETHFKLVKYCLPYTNVFVEKPLAENVSQSRTLDALAKKYGHLLMVGHIFRFHPVTIKLLEILKNRRFPIQIDGVFTNPVISDYGKEPALEFLHLFDVVDYFWRRNPESVWSSKEKRVSNVHIKYGKGHNGKFLLGWVGNDKIRTLKFKYPNFNIEADYTLNTVKVNGNIYNCPTVVEPLRAEVLSFIESIKDGKGKSDVDGEIGARIVSIAERAISLRNKMPKVAVIGGGIFGTSIAAELGGFCKVTIFEKNGELLQEGSHINQFRHHYGYHYPRSDETVSDIKNSRKDFEKIFSKAILWGIPTYYGLAKDNSLVSPMSFIKFCKRHDLPYEREFPSGDLMNKKEISLSIKVPEPSYHYERLKEITVARIKKIKNVKINYRSIVTSGVIEEHGKKVLSFTGNGKKMKKETFDFVVNATYANINQMSCWFDFPFFPIRVDLAEVLIVKIPIPPISLTVVDGPFATLMPTGNKNEFTLYHVKESIIDRYTPKNGLVRNRKKMVSRKRRIFEKSLVYFPILGSAKIIESRTVHRGVMANCEHSDARVAELVEHGFGCWSVLSGKILSSVSIGKRITKIIKNITK